MKMNFLRPFRRFSTIKEEPLIIKTLKNNVVTLTMNRSDRLNAWTKPMLLELVDSFHQAANDNDVKVL
jgi:enoyl-CoA hydratase/carnithine racemase